MSTTTAQALRHSANALLEAAGEEAAQQARLLVAHVLGVEVGALPAYKDQALTEAQEEALAALLARRQRREPLQYLLREWGFMGLTFQVRPDVLIPRQDTETLCEQALLLANERNYHTALDLCCGTGCVGITLAALGKLQVTMSDVSHACVDLARENAARYGVTAQILLGNWFEPVTERYDMIVCNPPYLSDVDMQERQPELLYEPSLALHGGPDGLCAYRAIREGYAAHLKPGGALLLEVGAGQAEAVAQLFGNARLVRDLNHVHRVVWVEYTMD